MQVEAIRRERHNAFTCEEKVSGISRIRSLRSPAVPGKASIHRARGEAAVLNLGVGMGCQNPTFAERKR